MGTPLDLLNHRQLLFVRAYTGRAFGDSTSAGRVAGYKPASASQVLKSAKVQDAVDYMLQDAGMTSAEVLARLSSQARASLRDFITWELVQDPITGQDRTLARIDLDKVESAHAWGNVSELTVKPDGTVRVKLHNVQRALELLGKARGLFIDRHEHSGPRGQPIPVNLGALDQDSLDKLEALLMTAEGKP
jgi:hypothetical protein